MTRLLYIFSAVVILGYFIWPFGTMLRFYLALKASDTPVVERIVDWPSVRRDIADDLNQIAGRMLNDKIGKSVARQGNRVKLSFKSVSTAEALATQIATPAAFIFLFNRPTQLHCFEGLQSVFGKELSADCKVIDAETQTDKKKKVSLRGPNLSRIYEKTNYLFFTDPITFEFDVLHDGVPVVLNFERRTFNWTITGLHVEWNKAIKSLQLLN